MVVADELLRKINAVQNEMLNRKDESEIAGSNRSDVRRIFFQITLLFTAIVSSQGCAIYYHDTESGADHIWGFGHLAMKATPPLDGKQAIVRKVTLTGAAIGIEEGSFGISVGFDQRERIDVYENTLVKIEKPTNKDFFYFKIGTYPINMKDLEQQSTLVNGE